MEVNLTEKFIRENCKKQIIASNLITIYNGINIFIDYWSRQSFKTKTYINLCKLHASMCYFIDALCGKQDSFNIFEMYYQLDHMSEDEIKKILKLPVKKDHEEKKKDLEVVKKNICESWSWMKKNFDPEKFKAKFPTEYTEFCKLKESNH